MRSIAAVLVGVLLATGLVRGATTQFGALRNKAKKALEAAGAEKKVAVDDDEDTGTPVMELASIIEVTPGSSAALAVGGTFSAKTRFTMSGHGFTLTPQTTAANKFEATVAAAPGLLPGAAMLSASNRRGHSEAIVAYVAGPWQIDGTLDNGWRARLAPATPKKPGTLAFTAEFFEGAAKTPFITRGANTALRPQTSEKASYTVLFEAPDYTAGFGDAECDPIMKRANELAAKLMAAKTKAEEDRVSAEVDKIQDKIDACVEKQQDNADKIAARQKELAAKRKAEEKFTCTGLELSVAPDGTAEGTLNCAAASPAFKGTMKAAGR